MQFRRRDMNDGAEELLTIVRLDGEEFWSEALLRETPFAVQVEQGDHFAGLFDLDGEELPDGNREWAEAVPVPADVVDAVEDGWASGSYVVERMKP